ncbi:MAG: arginine decarboxylase, pyruvoyl-dependent [Acidobacteria bacterium]|nr:arginine decarboxylase, pyruvoyl-dependent [Acidobacteriota bacterium]
MSMIIPAKVFLTRGHGQHKEKLASLELALREAGIAPFNLVKVSSIFPPSCLLIPREEGLKQLNPGQITYLVMSENATDEGHRLVTASVGLAQPSDPKQYGYLSEHHSFGQDEKEAGQYAEDLAAYMLATTMGKDFDLEQIWNDEKSVYEFSDDIIVKTQNITQTSHGKKGFWTTVITAAVMLP